jgi:hypothetical protein
MRPDELSEIIGYVRDQRVGDQPFEVAMEGMSPGPAQLHDLSGEYRKVGLTWWIEKLGWWRGPVDAAAERIRAGPPR